MRRARRTPAVAVEEAPPPASEEGTLLEWESRGWEALSRALDAAFAQESQRAFMSDVYGWMFTGLCVSGVTAVLTARSETMMLNAEYYAWLLLIAGVAAAFTLPAFIRQRSGHEVMALFLGYSLLNGVTFAVFFDQYSLAEVVGQALLVTAGAFGALSVFTTLTKRDLSARSAFLFMGLFGLLSAGLVQLLVPRPLEFSLFFSILSCGSVGIFAALLVHDEKELRKLPPSKGYSSSMPVSIIAAVDIYLGVILHVQRTLGRFSRSRRLPRARHFHNFP